MFELICIRIVCKCQFLLPHLVQLITFLDFASTKTPENARTMAEGEGLVTIAQKHEVTLHSSSCTGERL